MRNMIKKLASVAKKNWITLWLIVAIIAASGFAVFARYNNRSNIVKRVVSTQKGDTILFSSNLLSTAGSQQIRNVEVTENSDQFFDISIYDFDLKNPGTFYVTDIDYDLSVSFWNGSGTQQLTSSQIEALIGSDSVRLYGFSGSDVSESPFLSVNKDTSSANSTVRRTVTKTLSVDVFRMVLPISLKDKDISVKVVASPVGYADLPQNISAIFMIKSQTFTAISGWNGDFNDDRTIPLSQYDGFNYSIVGSGEAEGILYWNNTMLEPNKYQLDEMKKTGATIQTNGSTSSIVVSLDSTNNGGRYDIQFYVKNDTNGSGRASIDSMTWPTFADQTSGVVRFVTTSQ